ncbi:ATP-binding protein [Caulobacter sp. 17J80-11]|uniref:hybrid sensor histidine kinase/response regulator n=1 Tax=Caulobacter sp. 17J80-11 TaxID=2763502 RepID=UPI001653B8BF|nr:ATP-binding protein [Caulobacter sp. 17J80-11]MBC6983652.1 response regulator [Caulobacter sp. 17J80-11]
MDIAAPVPVDEQERLAVLHDLGLLEAAPTLGLDRLTRLATVVAEAPFGLAALVDVDEVRYKAAVGLDADGALRHRSFSAWVILADEPLWVADAFEDDRFREASKGKGRPDFRAYAGAPITVQGRRVGALCVGWFAPRPYDAAVASHISELASLISDEFELHAAKTRLAAALEETRQSENRLKLATEIADLTVWEYSYVRQSLEYAVGDVPTVFHGQRDYESFVGEWLNLLHPEDQAWVERAWREHVETGARFACEYRQKGRRGDEIWVRNVAQATRDEEGRPDRIVGVIRNITARKRSELAVARAREQAETASRAKSEFLANMSHEIRTPLNGVLGVAGALARTELAPGQRGMVRLIETSAETLEVLLSDLLDLARIESGRMELAAEPFDLEEATRSVAALFEAKAAEKGLNFEVELHADAKGRFVGDVVRVRQILANLLSNAVKFTDRGGVRLSVRTTCGRERCTLRFEVADTGIGFDESFRARLYERFEQADGSITRRFGGTGLGLSICKSLAELMGGRLDAVATPGEGATFSLEAPFDRAPAAAAETGAPPCVEVAPLRRARVLLAEDHPTNRTVVELILAGADVDLVSVENGAEALDAFTPGAFDLVLMDMQMPVMDGLSAIRAIRRLEAQAGASRTPVYALTANALPEHAEASRAAGADDHLTKPLSAATLLASVARAVAQRASVEAGVEAA